MTKQTGRLATARYTLCNASLLCVREAHQRGRALDTAYRADLAAENRRDVNEVGHVDFDDDVVGPHDLVYFLNAGYLGQRLVHALGGAGIGYDQDVCFDHLSLS